MTLIVESERWCEVPLSVPSDNGDCTVCNEAALTLCQSCGMAICDEHEKLCQRCGQSYCSKCQHACVQNAVRRKAA
jgi:predicted sulfurtransferase